MSERDNMYPFARDLKVKFPAEIQNDLAQIKEKMFWDGYKADVIRYLINLGLDEHKRRKGRK